MIIKSNPHGKGGNIIPSFPIEVKKEIPHPVVEVKEEEEVVDNPDDGEGEG